MKMQGTKEDVAQTIVGTGIGQGHLFWLRLPAPMVKAARLLLIAILAVANPLPKGDAQTPPASVAQKGDAQTPPASVAQIKVAYLYNFAKLVDWPADVFKDPNTPIVLGIVGTDPFGDILDQNMVGRTANGRKLVIMRLKASDNLKACHLLFISSSEKSRLAQILAGLKGASILTVGDLPHFIQSGGIINFFQEENRVQFEINVGAAERARLKISSRLLTLAKLVKEESHAGRI